MLSSPSYHVGIGTIRFIMSKRFLCIAILNCCSRDHTRSFIGPFNSHVYYTVAKCDVNILTPTFLRILILRSRGLVPTYLAFSVWLGHLDSHHAGVVSMSTPIGIVWSFWSLRSGRISQALYSLTVEVCSCIMIGSWAVPLGRCLRTEMDTSLPLCLESTLHWLEAPGWETRGISFS